MLFFLVGVETKILSGSLPDFCRVTFLLIISKPERGERVTAFSIRGLTNGTGLAVKSGVNRFRARRMVWYGFGRQIKKLFYLPEAHNDFILAVIAEETGILGCSCFYKVTI